MAPARHADATAQQTRPARASRVAARVESRGGELHPMPADEGDRQARRARGDSRGRRWRVGGEVYCGYVADGTDTAAELESRRVPSLGWESLEETAAGRLPGSQLVLGVRGRMH